ncbi:MAG TPA: hypothetical protein PKH98_06735, partial [Candidatus Omnitrophota bacterium]|nr:hypothetical protein [Candidatus Omnitrophota bacterium]
MGIGRTWDVLWGEKFGFQADGTVQREFDNITEEYVSDRYILLYLRHGNAQEMQYLFPEGARD